MAKRMSGVRWDMALCADCRKDGFKAGAEAMRKAIYKQLPSVLARAMRCGHAQQKDYMENRFPSLEEFVSHGESLARDMADYLIENTPLPTPEAQEGGPDGLCTQHRKKREDAHG